MARPDPPAGVDLVRFDPARHARAARELLNMAYRDGGGSVEPFEQWWPSLVTDTEYDVRLCIAAAETGTGGLIGFAQCWTSGFIKDIAVHPAWRRRGLGKALMTQIFNVFKARGLASVSLKVERGNPHGAVHFYRGLGLGEAGA